MYHKIIPLIKELELAINLGPVPTKEQTQEIQKQLNNLIQIISK